jgi:flagellar motor switch protein FliN/FliY
VYVDEVEEEMSQVIKGPDGATAITHHLETALARSLSGMTGKEFVVAADTKADPGDLADAMIWEQTFSFSGEPCLWIVAGKDMWSAAGRLTLEAVGIDTLTDDECRSTWQEIAGQSMGVLASEITADIQQEVNAAKGTEVAALPDNVTATAFTATCGAESWAIKVAWARTLIAVYDRPEPEQKTSSTRDAGFSKTFDLLLDVALPVSVSFGRTSLQIREVLKLNTGSIVELNRFVTEPVDVIVNDCVIARGEVVVVDGNYGVRITQLSSREDRLRTGMKDVPVRIGEPLR